MHKGELCEVYVEWQNFDEPLSEIDTITTNTWYHHQFCKYGLQQQDVNAVNAFLRRGPPGMID